MPSLTLHLALLISSFIPLTTADFQLNYPPARGYNGGFGVCSWGKSCHCTLVDVDTWGKTRSTSANKALWLCEDFYWSEKLEKLLPMMTLT